jgi:hypothetical protein
VARENAAWLAGVVGPSLWLEPVPSLLADCLDDADPQVRRAAAAAFVNPSIAVEAAPRVLDRLIAALRDPSPEVRREVVATLTHLAGRMEFPPAAGEALRRTLLELLAEPQEAALAAQLGRLLARTLSLAGTPAQRQADCRYLLVRYLHEPAAEAQGVSAGLLGAMDPETLAGPVLDRLMRLLGEGSLAPEQTWAVAETLGRFMACGQRIFPGPPSGCHRWVCRQVEALARLEPGKIPNRKS